MNSFFDNDVAVKPFGKNIKLYLTYTKPGALTMACSDELLPIDTLEDLETYLEKGYELVGPRGDPDKDKRAMAQFFKKGHIFFPEGCLVSDGCSIVQPGPLTKGLQFAYKCEGEDMFRWHKSKYSLKKDDTEVALYLKSPEH